MVSKGEANGVRPLRHGMMSELTAMRPDASRACNKPDADRSSMDLEDIMAKYICDVCGYIYDPEVGDPDGGIEPGTAFEDIPEDWVCPVCGVGKDDFSLYED